MTNPPDEPLLSSSEEVGPKDSDVDALAKTLDEFSWLLRQCWADTLNLLSVESRLVLRSLVFMAALIFCLAGLLAGTWLVLVMSFIYGASALNMPSWAIAIGVFVLHVLVFVGVAQQMFALGRLLSFPRSRKAAAELLTRQAAHPD